MKLATNEVQPIFPQENAFSANTTTTTTLTTQHQIIDTSMDWINSPEHLETIKGIGENKFNYFPDMDDHFIINDNVPVIQVEEIKLPLFSFFYNPVTNKYPSKQLNPISLYHLIKGNTYKDRTLKLRKIPQSRASGLNLLLDEKEIENYEIETNRLEKKIKDNELDFIGVSGTFSKLSDSDINKRSGLMIIDIDHVKNLEDVRQKLVGDPFTLLLFTSPRGDGLKWLLRIDTKYNHPDQYTAIRKYAIAKHNLTEKELDKSGKNISRACYLPHDPDIYINPQVLVDNSILHIPVFSFEEYHSEVIQITPATNVSGLPINPEHLKKHGKKALETANKMIANAVNGEKYFVLSKASFLLGGYVAGGYLEEDFAIEFLKGEISKKGNIIDLNAAFKTIEDSVNKGKDKPIIINEQTLKTRNNKTLNTCFEIGLHYLNEVHAIVCNEITGKLESNGRILSEKDINSLFIAAKNADIEISSQNFNILLFSDEIKSYNPIKDFFDNNKGTIPTGYIDQLCDSVVSNMNNELKKTFIKKWLVGMVASAYDKNYNPLMLVFIGGINIGKTEFFRRLLPEELSDYFAQSKFDAGKDTEALMCEKLLILNDELDSLTKYEAKTFRNFISADKYTYRPPYGKLNITRDRLATLCGSTNEKEIINDWENNRRIIPIEINSINHNLYNAINKTSLLMEAWHLFKNEFNWNLSKDEITKLKGYSLDFRTLSLEGELLAKFFKPTNEDALLSTEYLTSTDILKVLEGETKNKISIKILGAELKQQGYVRQSKRIIQNAPPMKVYGVVRLKQNVDSVDGCRQINLTYLSTVKSQ